MRQRATVIEVNGNYATVEVKRQTMCEGCHKQSCDGGCELTGLFSSSRKTVAKAVNSAGARVGDIVEIESESREVLRSAALVFVLPLIITVAAYILGDVIFHTEGGALLSALGGFVLSFVGLVIADKVSKRTPVISVVGVITKTDDENNI